MLTKSYTGLLSGNALKLLAIVAMTLDHIVVVLGIWEPLRIPGRLAFPIFAYMIAEGCLYTRQKTRYFGGIFGLGLFCQVAYFIADGSLYQCILMTFSLSIFLIFALQRAQARGGLAWLGFVMALGLVYALCSLLPHLLSGTDYAVDYGFWGALLPLFIFLGRSPAQKLGMTALGLVLICLGSMPLQWYSLLTLIPLALYNGRRGTWRLKHLFYIYYPSHLTVLWGLALLF